jgi:NAD(P)-dependent dehydrogenase (short-subunit alcohol dehydrogenase family)
MWELGASFTPLHFDVRDEAAVAAAAKEVRASLGSQTLNGLVNNAGIGFAGPCARGSSIEPCVGYRTRLSLELSSQVCVE